MNKHKENFYNQKYEIYKAKYNGEALRIRQIGQSPRTAMLTKNQFKTVYDATNYKGSKIDVIVDRQLYRQRTKYVIKAASNYRKTYGGTLAEARRAVRTMQTTEVHDLLEDDINKYIKENNLDKVSSEARAQAIGNEFFRSE